MFLNAFDTRFFAATLSRVRMRACVSVCECVCVPRCNESCVSSGLAGGAVCCCAYYSYQRLIPTLDKTSFSSVTGDRLLFPLSSSVAVHKQQAHPHTPNVSGPCSWH